MSDHGHIVLHVTDKSRIGSILKDGIRCFDYSLGEKRNEGYRWHPLGTRCTTFFYPLNGVDSQLASRELNARFRGEELDDEYYVVARVDGCMIGDLTLEGAPKEYMRNLMPLTEYMESDVNRARFKEPEVVCQSRVPRENILKAIPFSKMKENFEVCRGQLNSLGCLEGRLTV